MLNEKISVEYQEQQYLQLWEVLHKIIYFWVGEDLFLEENVKMRELRLLEYFLLVFQLLLNYLLYLRTQIKRLSVFEKQYQNNEKMR